MYISDVQQATPAPSMKDEVQKWYADFVEVDHDTQFALLAASGYLDIQPLCDLICPAIVTKVQGKSHGEIRELYKVSYDSIADFDKFDDDSICHSQCSSSHGVSSKNSKNSEDTGTNKKIDSTKN